MLEILILHMFSNNCTWVDPQIVVWRTLIVNLVDWIKENNIRSESDNVVFKVARMGTLPAVQGARAEWLNRICVLTSIKKERPS